MKCMNVLKGGLVRINYLKAQYNKDMEHYRAKVQQVKLHCLRFVKLYVIELRSN
jgi:hypothetical protein